MFSIFVGVIGLGADLIPVLLAPQVVAPQANRTTVIELSGIKTAQTKGDNTPAAAMPTPTKLYAAETAKLARTTRVL